MRIVRRWRGEVRVVVIKDGGRRPVTERGLY